MIGTKGIFVRTLDIDGAKYYLYGIEHKSHLSEINIPMYIQITDAAAIRLFRMIKEMGGQLAYIKVDCAVTIGGLQIQESSEWGGYRKSPLPKCMGQLDLKTAEFTPIKEWTLHPFNDSDQWMEIFKIATEQGGVLIQGRAGTGKTYAAIEGAKHLKQINKIAFTNKAALQL